MISRNKRIEQEFYRFLSNNDMELDKPLKKIIVHFFRSEHHLSQQDLQEYAGKKGLKLSDKTLQKLLHLLTDYGFAQKLKFEDGVSRYEHLHLDEHHDHFICMRCRKIIEFHSPRLEKDQNDLAGKSRFHPFWHKMEVYGLCSECFGKSEGVSIPLSSIHNGAFIKITELSGKGRMQRRLLDMGITPGIEAQVINNHMGLVALAVRGQRIGIGRGMSKRIQVELVN